MARTADVALGGWSSESASWSFPLARLAIQVEALHVDGQSVPADRFVVDEAHGRLVWPGPPPSDPARANATVTVASKAGGGGRHWWIPVGVAVIGAIGAASGAVVKALTDDCPSDLERAEQAIKTCSQEKATVVRNLVRVGQLCSPSSAPP